MKKSRFVVAAVMMSLGLFALSQTVFAQDSTQGSTQSANQGSAQGTTPKSTWAQKHPRRAQVNKRLKNQNKRINEGVKSGKLTQDQATQLKTEDKQIRQEERTMASENGSHITKTEQKALNQQENAVSKQIYQEKHGK